jgi:hypothetical protein
MGLFSKIFASKEDDIPLEVDVDVDVDVESQAGSPIRTPPRSAGQASRPPTPASSPRDVGAPTGRAPRKDESMVPAVPRPAARTRSAPRHIAAPEVPQRSPRLSPPVSPPPRVTPVPRGDTEPMTVEPPPMRSPLPTPALRKPIEKQPISPPSRTKSRVAVPSNGLAVEDSSGDLAKDLDQAFEEVEHRGPGPAGPGQLAQDTPAREEIERLFRQIAAEHARHLRDFAFELSTGETSKQWAELCSPSIVALRDAAAKMQQKPLHEALRQLEAVVEEARTASGPRIDGELRQRLLERYVALQQALPEAFADQSGERRREPIIIDALLRLVPGMHRIAIDKVYAAGIDSLSRFRAATTFDLAHTTGLDEPLCEAIVERFARHREERATATPDELRTHERAQLGDLVGKLRQRHADFREAEVQEDLALKRKLRNERKTLVLELDLVLAHLGELELIYELERAPVERKIERLEEFTRAKATSTAVSRPSRGQHSRELRNTGQ